MERGWTRGADSIRETPRARRLLASRVRGAECSNAPPGTAPVMLALLLAAVTACNRTTASPTTPAAADAALKPSFTAEPLKVRPEFLPLVLVYRLDRRSVFELPSSLERGKTLFSGD